jgi:hypothetical protein
MVKNPKGGKHLQEEFVWIVVMFPHQIFLISYLGIIREERLEIWQPQINEKAGWKKRKKKKKKERECSNLNYVMGHVVSLVKSPTFLKPLLSIYKYPFASSISLINTKARTRNTSAIYIFCLGRYRNIAFNCLFLCVKDKRDGSVNISSAYFLLSW